MEASNLKKHLLVADNHDHFVIHDQEGNEFKVAKSQTDPFIHKKITSLERHQNFACGGMVKGYAEGTPDEPVQAPASTERYVPENLKPRQGPILPEWMTKQIGSAPSPEALSKYGSVDEAMKAEKFYKEKGTPAAAIAPENPVYEAPAGPQAAPEAPKVDVTTAPGAAPASNVQGPPSPTPEQQLQGAGADVMNATNDWAAQMKKTSAQGAAAYVKAAEELRRHNEQFQRDAGDLDLKNQTLHDDILNQKINPNQVWENTSSANKVLAAIGVVLGGIGGGMQGTGKNMALESINRTIDLDIDAQKANLNNKQSLLSKNLEQYRNMHVAEQATRNQLMAPVLAQISALEASNIGPAAAKQAAEAKMAIQQMVSQKNQEIAKLMGGYRMAAGEGTPADLLTNPDAAKSAVKLPSGKYGMTFQPEEGKELREKTASTSSAFKIADRIEELGPALWGAKKEQGKQLASDMKIALMQAKGLNPKMVESSMKMLDDAIENPTDWKNILYDSGKTRSLKKTLQDSLESEMSSKVMNYKSAIPEKIK